LDAIKIHNSRIYFIATLPSFSNTGEVRLKHGKYVTNLSTDGSVEDVARSVELPKAILHFHRDLVNTLPKIEGAIDLEWIAFAQGGQEALDTHGVGRIVDGINAALNADKFYVINGALGSADVSVMSLEAMVAFLRVPFTARFRLNKWHQFLQKARNEMNQRGLDSTRLLRGLV